MQSTPRLEDAVAALRAKDKLQARKILKGVINENPQNDQAWVCLALAVENRKQALSCLERATQINPANDRAWELLKKLESQSTGKTKRGNTPDKGNVNIRLFALIGAGSLLILTFLFMGILYVGGYLSIGKTVTNPTSSISTEIPVDNASDVLDLAATMITPTRESPPTWTPTPTREVPPTWTPTPEVAPVISGNPQDFCLTLADLPEDFNFDQENSGPITNEQIALAHENPQEFLVMLEEWGRISGYRTVYNTPSDNPVFYVESLVVTLKTSNGTDAYFQYVKEQDEQSDGLNVSVPLIADDSYGRLTDWHDELLFTLTFRKQNVLVSVYIIGKGDSLSEDAVKYAQIIESKLSMASHSTQSTPVPKLTPTPMFIETTSSLGPIRRTSYDETFSVEITIHNVEWRASNNYTQAKSGYTYAHVYLTIKNLGPGPMRSIRSSDFQTLDANGALRSARRFVDNCDFDFVDLLAGGKISGCLAFEVPDSGQLEFIYAPYQYGNLEPGRYINIMLRP